MQGAVASCGFCSGNVSPGSLESLEFRTLEGAGLRVSSHGCELEAWGKNVDRPESPGIRRDTLSAVLGLLHSHSFQPRA